MFFNNQPKEQRQKYKSLLQLIGALSKLSSDNDSIPYLYYRMSEKIFCKAFSAKDLSRSDISIDASKNNFGIGIKTFLYKNGKTFEKIAEFNKCQQDIASSKPLELVKAIAKLRNERLAAINGIGDVHLNKMFYHCIARTAGKFIVHESQMQLIEIQNITKPKESNNTIKFTDGIEEYSYNKTKSTLFKKFNITPIDEINIDILNEPYQMLEKHLTSEINGEDKVQNKIVSTIYLPLYSEKKETPYVPERSGLNQWNAEGRSRNDNEVYIRVPIKIHKTFPSFFPPNKTSFMLHLPNGKTLSAKICQVSDKALMTNPNSALGEWILRDILHLQKGELATYKKLEEIGIDSVEINKFTDETYEINFKKIDTYKQFKEDYLKQ